MLHSREHLFQFISPLSVLMGLMRLRPLYEKHSSDGVIVSEIGLDRTSGSPSDEELARLYRDAPLIRQQLEDDPDFRRAMERLDAAGVRHEFGGQGDACGQFTVLRFKAKATSFPALEALAAEDAGIFDPAERQAAADRFRIYVLRNHDDNWRSNREKYPDVGGCPYSDPAFWPEDT